MGPPPPQPPPGDHPFAFGVGRPGEYSLHLQQQQQQQGRNPDHRYYPHHHQRGRGKRRGKGRGRVKDQWRGSGSGPGPGPGFNSVGSSSVRPAVPMMASTRTLDLSLRPRSFAELTGERALLLDELQRRDDDVRELFVRLSMVSAGTGAGVEPPTMKIYDDDDDDIKDCGGSVYDYEKHVQGRQKGPKKQWWDQQGKKFQRDLCGFLQRRIENAVDKERAILVRLGELSVEIQVSEFREWARGKNERERASEGASEEVFS